MARALYETPPSAEEAAVWGLTAEEAAGPPIEIWPCNLHAHNVMQAMRTQWNYTMGAVVGLVYSSLPEIWRRMGVPAKDRDRVFEQIRVMEDEALTVMRKKA